MQRTFKGLTAQQVLAQSTKSTAGPLITYINGVFFTVIPHERVELNNGNWTSTVVIQNAQDRIVLEA